MIIFVDGVYIFYREIMLLFKIKFNSGGLFMGKKGYLQYVGEEIYAIEVDINKILILEIIDIIRKI